MAWLSRNDFTNSDKLYSSALNNLANDDRAWGGNVNGGGYTLSNVVLGANISGVQTPWASNINAAGFNLLSVGNLGIGAATPAAALHCVGVQAGPSLGVSAPAVAKFTSTAGGPSLLIHSENASASPAISLQAKNESFLLAYPLLLNPSGGNVGIGAVNPAVKLQVGDSSGQFTARVQGGAAADLAPVISLYRTSVADVALAVSGAGLMIAANPASYTDAALQASTKFFIASGSGNVGIGKTNPGYMLDVNGEINATGFRLNGTPHLATLAAGPDDLPPKGGLNLWLDEAAGRIAVRYRNSAGVLKTGYIPID